MKVAIAVPWILSALLLCGQAQDEVYKNPDASVQDRVEDLLSRMTLREKISQMVMDIQDTFENAPGIGAYFIGPSDPPGDNSPEAWRLRQNQLHAVSSNQRLGIPILFAADAVHGQNILSGATIVPHNIGLGATRNPSLVRQLAQVTAEECMSSALDMTFAPMIAVARTETSGRTYESYSEDTDTVRSFVVDFIQGLQGSTLPWNVIGTAKHWVGDGGTDGGIDAGDTSLSEADLLQIHGAPYIDAIEADVGSIMVSFNSIDGVQMHQHTHLITDVLKGVMGFQGFVLSDWEGFMRNDGDYDNQLRLAINAGIDMLMAPYMAYRIIDSVSNSSDYGLIDESRIDDAARRILNAKFKAGLFEKKLDPIDPYTYNPIGTSAHRTIARQAVRESLVLLKNKNNVLPQAKTSRIFLAGKTADNIQNQCGGWTMSWQGNSTEARHVIVGGKTIREGLESLGNGSVTFVQDGSGADPDEHDVAIVVVGETPYAEFEGYKDDLSLDQEDQTTITNVKASGVPMVLVIVSGRPMIITNEIEDVDTVVAAWLPGTEGDGIAEVFFGDYDFTGTLSFSWPADMAQVLNGFVGDNPNVLFPFGFGLNYESAVETEAPTTSPSVTSSSPPTTNKTIAPTEAPISDDESPSVPGTPILTDLSSTTASFKWTRSTDDVAVTRYDIYDGATLFGSATTNSFTASGLSPKTEYTFTVVALDAQENESSSSDPLQVVTLVMVDDFDDEDNVAKDSWGLWFSTCNGTLSNGGSALQYLPGYDGFGARLDYEVDSGEWGFCNIFLDFDHGNAVNLTSFQISGIRFQLQGSEGSIVSLEVGTPLAEDNWIYYETSLQPTPSWTTVTVAFDEFIAKSGVSYTLAEALENAATLVWEVRDVGQIGWFMIDNVDFALTATGGNSRGDEDSGEDENSDEESDGEDLSGNDPADYFSTSGVVGLSWVGSILISLTFGILQWENTYFLPPSFFSKTIAIKE